MIKSRSLVLLVGLFFTIPLLMLLLHDEDSNYLNFKYLYWKAGLGPYNPSYVEHVVSDYRFQQKLKAKTLNDVIRYFPDLREKEKANAYQHFYTPKIKQQDFYWIGQSNLIIVFKDGKLLRFDLWKG